MTVASDLQTLGWRNGSPQSVLDFQRAFNIGTPLAADGKAGPKTGAALELAMERRRQKLPDISANFSARELACECGGKYADCRRIWTPRAVIRGLEVLRTYTGPFTPDRAGRCETQNRNVGGVPKSLHLSGYAVDIPVFKFTVAQMRSLRLWSGIGFYDYGPEFCRHVDMRHLKGMTSTVGNPALWEYPGADKHVPLPLRPGNHKPVPVVEKPATPPSIPRSAFLTEDGIGDEGTLKAFGRMWGLKNPSGRWDDELIRAAQRWAKVTVDGKLGPATTRAIQTKVSAPHEPWSYNWSTRWTRTTEYIEKYYNRGVRANGHGF